MLEKPKETKLHVLIDLSGRVGRKDGRVGSRKRRLGGVLVWRRGGAAWWRRCDFTDVPPHIPVLQTGIPLGNKIFLG